ncbi:GerMN domain-containing protein [Pseudarthrobacter sp. alpha12b]
MAKSWSWEGYRRGALAVAAGCLVLVPSGCSLPLSQPGGSSPPLAGADAGSSAAPLALLPATPPGTPSEGESGKAEDQHAAGFPDPGSSAGATVPPVTAYFVLVDDGGRHGVRFGCNDSLVGSAQAGGAGDARLKAAVGALLGDGRQPGNLYNALGASRLKFLSGSFDGTTVTVYLAGTLNAGGTCDLSRVEAQLTQTALEAVGAIRANIYINGESLADYLKLK